MRPLIRALACLVPLAIATPAVAGPLDAQNPDREAGAQFADGRHGADGTPHTAATAAQVGTAARTARGTITTHVLDTTRGLPAAGVPITLEYQKSGGWVTLGAGKTNQDGRIPNLLDPSHTPAPGRYRLTFDTLAYFRAIGTEGFYPVVTVVFDLTAPGQHYHIPLLLSPFGYATYRGS